MQKTTVAGYLDEPRFGTTKAGKPYLSCSIAVKVETDRGQNNELIFTTYRYQFSFWGDKAADYNARHVVVKGQYVMISGTVKMTAYINDHPKNPADKGKPGINIDFLPGFDLDLGGARPADAPAMVPRSQAQQGDGQQGGNGGYNNNRGNGNNYNRGGGNNYNRGQGNGGNQNYNNGGQNNNYQAPQAPAQPPPQQNGGWNGDPQPNQYSGGYAPNPYGE
jgi:hypothetical protein